MNITYSAEAHDAIRKAGVRPEFDRHVTDIIGEYPIAIPEPRPCDDVLNDIIRQAGEPRRAGETL